MGISKSSISVIIPVRDRSEELRRALRSVLDQRSSPQEIWVIDNGSREDIEGVCKAFEDERIHYHRLEGEGNGNSARNRGMELATTSFIAFLDSDDEWFPEHLERKRHYIEERSADGVFGSAQVEGPNGRRDYISRPFMKGESMLDYYANGGLAQTSSFFFRTEAIRQCPFDEELARNQDLELAIRFDRSFRFVPDPQVTTLIHWEREERELDPESNARFLERYAPDMKPRTFIVYANRILGSIGDPEKKKELRDRIRPFFMARIGHASLSDLQTFLGVKNKKERAFARLQYLWAVLFS